MRTGSVPVAVTIGIVDACALSGLRRDRSSHHDRVDAEPDQIRRKGPDLFLIALPETGLKSNIPSFDVAQFAQARLEGRPPFEAPGLGLAVIEQADAIDLARRLRSERERRNGGGAGNERDKISDVA